jgi:hypothetical protein
MGSMDSIDFMDSMDLQMVESMDEWIDSSMYSMDTMYSWIL